MPYGAELNIPASAAGPARGERPWTSRSSTACTSRGGGYGITPEPHCTLGDMFVTDPWFTKSYESVRAGMAQYVRDASHASVRCSAARADQRGASSADLRIGDEAQAKGGPWVLGQYAVASDGVDTTLIWQTGAVAGAGAPALRSKMLVSCRPLAAGRSVNGMTAKYATLRNRVSAAQRGILISRQVSGGGLAHQGHTPSTSGSLPSLSVSRSVSSANVRSSRVRRGVGHDSQARLPGDGHQAFLMPDCYLRRTAAV